MRLLCLTLLFCVPVFYVQAQPSITISGKILDQETSEPLVFASIGVRGKSIGTISNKIGEFDFHIPSDFKNEVLIIRMLGYENVEVPIRSLLREEPVVFKLKKAAQMLDEVVIQDTLAGSDIVNIALSKIEENYPMTPFLLEGFYRDLKKVGGIYFSLLEAAVKIYDEDYKAPRNKNRLRERVALMEVRKSLGYNNRFTKYFDQNNLLEDLLLHNNIKYRRFEMTPSFLNSFKRLRTSYYNGHRVFVVAMNTSYGLKMYVDTKSYAIIRLEINRSYDEAIIKKKKNLISKYISDKKVIDFKEYNGKMYLNYINLISKINWYDYNTDELKFETELYQELLINKINTDPDERIRSTEKMKRYGLQYQDEQYNKKFWSHYNVIKDTPLDQEIVADLEKLGNLDYQFEN